MKDYASELLRTIRPALAGLLLSTALLTAADKPEMPENFGAPEWAAAHWKEAVEYLKYVSKGEQREKLLQAPEGQREEIWRSFWSNLDPLKSTEINETTKIYFDRVRYANEHFTSALQVGWKTEMGEAWIRMGQPQNIERYTMRRSGRDIEVWEYLTSHGTTLVFMDQTGVGNWYLLNPGALLDEVYLRN